SFTPSNISASPRTGRLDADGLLGFCQYAAQDVHLDLIGLAALVEPAQTRHQLLRLLGIKEADLHHHLLQMLVEQLHLFGGYRGFLPGRRLGKGGRQILASEALHAQLIAQHLHRRRQIQRAEVGVGRDMHMVAATLQLLTGKPGVLATEYQRDRAAGRRLQLRSEERRVGKECRYQWTTEHEKRTKDNYK